MSALTPEQLERLPPQYLAQDDGRPLFNVSIAFIVLQTFFFTLYRLAIHCEGIIPWHRNVAVHPGGVLVLHGPLHKWHS